MNKKLKKELNERDKARNAISKLLAHIDNDIWKSYFLPEAFEEDEEDVEQNIDKLIDIVLKEMK